VGYEGGIWRWDMEVGYGGGIWRWDMEVGYGGGIWRWDMDDGRVMWWWEGWAGSHEVGWKGGCSSPPFRREALTMAPLTMAPLAMAPLAMAPLAMAPLTMALPPLRREELGVPRATLEGEQRAVSAAERERRERGHVRGGHGPAGQPRGCGGLERAQWLERYDVPQRHGAVARGREVEPLVRHPQELAHGHGVAQRRAGRRRAR
jgi:hypothetical protein